MRMSRLGSSAFFPDERLVLSLTTYRVKVKNGFLRTDNSDDFSMILSLFLFFERSSFTRLGRPQTNFLGAAAPGSPA